ncbi:helix-turn-helix domain-containing protein [Sinosporangium album]|nr:helix-turn-helix transcriptional regulator [Sinosporangium album]
MTSFPRWGEIRADLVAASDGEEAVAEARKLSQAFMDGHRLAERRDAMGLSQADVADRMRVPKSRVSQIERGEISTVEAIARYAEVLGGSVFVRADKSLEGSSVGMKSAAKSMGRVVLGVKE